MVDFVNQYGLYPHFIEPVLGLVGLGVYSFTALMGLLSCLAYGCFCRFLARETNDELLAFLGLATLVFFGYIAGRVAEPDLYLQYQPLRLLFPAFAVLLVSSFARRPTKARVAGLAALGAVSILWNTDTGAVLLAMVFLLVTNDALLRRRPRYGGFPDWLQLFAPFKAFYSLGAYMQPMPSYGLWVPVIVVYAAALPSARKSASRGWKRRMS